MHKMNANNNKRSKNSSDHDISESASVSSSDDDSSGHNDARGSDEEEAADNDNNGDNQNLHYSDHITMVCNALNTEVKTQPSNFDKNKLETRRMTNRASAKRRRQRRKNQMELLQQQLCQLQAESMELAADNARLKEEFQREVSMPTTNTTTTPAFTMPQRQVHQQQQEQQLSQEYRHPMWMLSNQASLSLHQEVYHQSQQTRLFPNMISTSSSSGIDPTTASFLTRPAAAHAASAAASLCWPNSNNINYTNLQRLLYSQATSPFTQPSLLMAVAAGNNTYPIIDQVARRSAAAAMTTYSQVPAEELGKWNEANFRDGDN